MLAEEARTMILRAPICLDERHLSRSGQSRLNSAMWPAMDDRKPKVELILTPDDLSRLALDEDRSTVHSGPIGPNFRFHVIFGDHQPIAWRHVALWHPNKLFTCVSNDPTFMQ